MKTMFDVTVRPKTDPEVSLQPDGTVELFWQMAPKQALTVLLTADGARRLVSRVLEVELEPAKVPGLLAMAVVLSSGVLA
jgi:hypothetical protein